MDTREIDSGGCENESGCEDESSSLEGTIMGGRPPLVAESEVAK